MEGTRLQSPFMETLQAWANDSRFFRPGSQVGGKSSDRDELAADRNSGFWKRIPNDCNPPAGE